MPHNCKYLISHCIDFRLGKPLKKYLEDKGILGQCDLVSAAGGVKNTDFLLGQIEISVNLHQIKEVILINHTDCGAYGGSKNFEFFEKERDFHIQEMEKARDLVLAKYPDLKVSLLLAVIDPSGSVDFQNISEQVVA